MNAFKEIYIGDGLYVSCDGFQIQLRAPRDYEDHECFLDSYTLQTFIGVLKDKEILKGVEVDE